MNYSDLLWEVLILYLILEPEHQYLSIFFLRFILRSEAQIRSKRELIEKFIAENLPHIVDNDDIPEAFEKFWNEEQIIAFKKICDEENLSTEKVEKIIESYLFAEREPLRDEVLALIEGNQPTILERKKVGDRILSKIMRFVETFINGMSAN